MKVTYVGAQGLPTIQQNVETQKEQALAQLRCIFSETKGHFHKIGISSNPTGRSYGHGKVAVDEREEGDMTYVTLQSGFWAEMHVIYQTSSPAAIRAAEREFIALARKEFADFQVHNLVSMNENPGGEGPLRPRGPHFLYVLRSVG